MAEQAKTLLPISDNRTPTGWITRATRERLHHGITCHQYQLRAGHGGHCHSQ
jgi:hypothetical protein